MKCQGCATAQVLGHCALTPEILVQSQVSPEICNGQIGSGTRLPQSTLVILSESFYRCPILIHLSLTLHNLSKRQLSLNNAPKSDKWYIKLFESVYKVAKYTTIHVTLNILTYGKLWYLATLWSQRYRIVTLTVYTVMLITKAMTSRKYRVLLSHWRWNLNMQPN